MKRWPTKPLGDFIAKKSGSVDPSQFPDETFDLYSIPAFDSGQPEVRAGSEIGSAKQIVEPGDTLLSRIVPHIRRAWVVGAPSGRRLIGSGEWIVFRSPQLHPRYLRFFLVGDPFHARFMQTVSGVGGSLLRAKATEVVKIKIPVPPLAEQERIVKLLDEADELRKLRAQADRRTAALLPALFHEMFGDPVANPKGWPSSTFADHLDLIEYGPRFYNETYSDSGPRIVRITDLDAAGNLNFSTMPRLQVDSETLQARGLQPGELVFARSGATVGKVAVIPDGAPSCIAGAYFIRIRFQPSIHPLYAAHLIRCPSVQSIITNNSRQSAQPNFSGPGIRSLPMPVPPLALQQEFAQRVTEIHALESAQAASRLRLENLFQSMLHRAFNGEL